MCTDLNGDLHSGVSQQVLQWANRWREVTLKSVPAVGYGKESRVTREIGLHSDIFLSKKQMKTHIDKQLLNTPSLWISQPKGG